MRFDAQLVKEQVSLAEIFRADGHELRKVGSAYVCKCPFHLEKTASCYVHDRPDNYFHCFGCGESGDVFKYWRKTRNCDFGEAIKQLAGDQASQPTRLPPQEEAQTEAPPGLPARMDGAVLEAWQAALERLKESPARQEAMAKWRGYSTATVTWANELGLLGLIPFLGQWREAFLVERPDDLSGGKSQRSEKPSGDDTNRDIGRDHARGPDASDSPRPPAQMNEGGDAICQSATQEQESRSSSSTSNAAPIVQSGGAAAMVPVGYHVRLGPHTAGNKSDKASWRYVPTGIGNWPFVLGDVSKARVLFFLEGQWDALALVDVMGWASGAELAVKEKNLSSGFPKHIAIVGMRGVTSWKRFIDHYTWSDDVVAFALCDADTAGRGWLAEGNFIDALRLRCKRVWSFFPGGSNIIKDFNDLCKDRVITRTELAGLFRDKMKRKIKGRRNAGPTFLQFCRAQKARQDEIGVAARIILADKKYRPAGRRPLPVWERYWHKHVPQERRSAMYATWREWVKQRDAAKKGVAA